MTVLSAYMRERFKPRVYLPALTLHLVAAWWAAGKAFGPGDVGLALVLLLQFRLWDDLEDRERDRITHVDRVTVREPVRPLQITLVVLAATALGWTWVADARSALELIALDAIFWLSYRHGRSHVSGTFWRFFVLTKYPAFVCVLAAAMGAPAASRLAIASAAVFACVCVYEVVHDRAGAAAPAPTRVR